MEETKLQRSFIFFRKKIYPLLEQSWVSSIMRLRISREKLDVLVRIFVICIEIFYCTDLVTVLNIYLLNDWDVQILDSQQTKKKESDCSRIGSQSSLPSYNEATSGIFTQNKKETKKKKKIIPVQSDFESSSPSPEPGVLPASLSPVPPAKTSIRMSQSSVNLARSQAEVEVRNVDNKVRLGLMLCIPDWSDQENSGEKVEKQLQWVSFFFLLIFNYVENFHSFLLTCLVLPHDWTIPETSSLHVSFCYNWLLISPL